MGAKGVAALRHWWAAPFLYDCKEAGKSVFIFPWCALNDEIKILSEEERKEKLEMMRTDHMRYMRVPFAINVMSGGQYEKKQNIRFGGISEGKKFTTKQEGEGTSIDGKMVFPEEWGIKDHQHDYYELMYVLEGAVEQQIENSTYVYQRGEGCFINRNTKHRELSGTDFFVVYLCLSKEYVWELIEEAGKTSGNIYRFLRSSMEEKSFYKKDYLYISVKENEDGITQTRNIFEKMTRELVEKESGYLHIFHGLVERLFGVLQNKEFYQVLHITLDSSVEEQLFEQIKRLIEQNPEKYSRQELAKELNYSGDYLNKIVKKFTGLTITHYCQKVLLKKAKALLQENGMSVSAVMAEVGFKNSSHFYELFKKEFGVLPGECRKVHK